MSYFVASLPLGQFVKLCGILSVFPDGHDYRKPQFDYSLKEYLVGEFEGGGVYLMLQDNTPIAFKIQN